MIDRIQKRLPLFTLHLLCFVLPLLFTATTDELFEFPKMLAVYAAATVLMASWLFQSISQRKIVFPKTVFTYPLLAFVGSQVLSTLFSINVHTSLYGYYSRFNGGLYSLFSYVVVFYAVLVFVKKEHAFSILRSLSIGGILAALYAFPEHFGHSPSCYLITGQFTADCWVQDVQTRIFGTLGQPNWLAALAVVVLPISLAFTMVNQEKILSQVKANLRTYLLFAGWVLSFLLFSFVIVYTKSRSGIAGAGVATGLSILCIYIRSIRNSKATTNMRVSSILLPTILVFIFSLLILTINNPVREKIAQKIRIPILSQTAPSAPTPVSGTQLDSGGSESGDIRKVVWNGALKVWVRYPLFGSGVETFAYAYYKDRPQEHNLLSEWDFLYNKAHNEFLNYLATSGAVGLISYVLLYGSFVVFPLLWAFKEKDSTLFQFQIAISAGLTGLAVSNFFGFSTVVVSMYTFLLPALAAVLSSRVVVQTVYIPRLLDKKISRTSSMVVVFVWMCSMLLGLYQQYSIDQSYAASKLMIGQQDVEEGVALLQNVVDSSPDEPVYRDEFAYTAARLSYALGTSGDSTSAARLAQAAIDQSDEVLRQNSANVNFYKTRARIFTLLGQMSPVFYAQAIETLLDARDLSPTDPKLTYNLAIISRAQSDGEAYEKYLVETLRLRPIDLVAQMELAKFYDENKKDEEAKREYTQVLKLDPTNQIAKDRIASLSASKKK